MAALSARNLTKRFGSLIAVDDVTFDIQEGSFFGLLGPNGAGKTTTISMIVGALKPDSGTVTVGPGEYASSTFQAKEVIGYVPQELALYEELSAFDNLRIFGALYGLRGSLLAERCDQVLKTVNLSDRAKDRASKFSGGMKRRLNIALALLHDPDVLVLDEPTVGVDPQSRNAIFDTLNALREGGKTILYTTHYMEEVERLCDQIAIMDHGKILTSGSLSELQRSSALVASLTLEVSDLDPQTVSTLAEQEGLESVSYSDPNLVIGATDLTACLATTMRVLDERGSVVTNVSSGRPSLESLFLEMTGRSLRD